MRADSINVNSGKFGAVDRTDLPSPIIGDYRQEVIRQSDDTDTAITLTVAQSGALVLFDEDEAYAITLPAVTKDDIGITYTFMETIASNTDRTVNTAYDNDYFVGSLVVLPSAVWASGTAQDGLATNTIANAANDVQLTFDDNLGNGAGIETGAVGKMARDIKDYIDTLDSTNNKVLSITHTQLRGDRIMTLVVGGA